MAQYQNLQATIDAQIKANGIQAITGPVLNAVLSSMVNVLGDGYRFRGIASPADNPGTPDNRVFYLAAGAGTYANFGDIVVPDDGNIYVITFDAAWAVLKTGIVTKSYVDGVFAKSPFRAGAGSGSAILTAGANLAPGKHAVGIGALAKANGDYSLVYGAACTADGKRGHAGGYGSQALEENAVALGDHVEANSKDEAAFGRYNRHNPDLYHLLFSVGMGTSADRRNAVQIDDDGKMYVCGIGGYYGGVVRDDGTIGMSLQDMLAYYPRAEETPWGVAQFTEEQANLFDQALAFYSGKYVLPRMSLQEVFVYDKIKSAIKAKIDEMQGDDGACEFRAAFGSIFREGMGPTISKASVFIVWYGPDNDGYYGYGVKI